MTVALHLLWTQPLHGWRYILDRCRPIRKLARTLMRHLSAHGMSPDRHPAKWGLPTGYPLTAPPYSASRSKMAKKLGLGRKPGTKIVRRNGEHGIYGLLRARSLDSFNDHPKELSSYLVAIG